MKRTLNENKMSIKSFNKATNPDKNKANDLNLSKNMSNEERALSQGVLKSSEKGEENGNIANIDDQALNSENNKSNNENSNNNTAENNLDSNKNENNISQNNTNEIDKANLDSTNIPKENDNDISNNIKKTGNLIVDLDEVNIEEANSGSRKGSIKKASTNSKIFKQLVLEKFTDRDKDTSVNENASSIEKEVPEEEKSSSKLIAIL